jgi:hypothetical protein
MDTQRGCRENAAIRWVEDAKGFTPSVCSREGAEEGFAIACECNECSPSQDQEVVRATLRNHSTRTRTRARTRTCQAPVRGWVRVGERSLLECRAAGLSHMPMVAKEDGNVNEFDRLRAFS